MKTLGDAYSLDETVTVDEIEVVLIAYILLHYLDCHLWFITLNNEWTAGKYFQTGFDLADYGHSIFHG